MFIEGVVEIHVLVAGESWINRNAEEATLRIGTQAGNQIERGGRLEHLVLIDEEFTRLGTDQQAAVGRKRECCRTGYTGDQRIGKVSR